MRYMPVTATIAAIVIVSIAASSLICVLRLAYSMLYLLFLLL